MNNRRGKILTIDPEKQLVYIQWLDAVKTTKDDPKNDPVRVDVYGEGEDEENDQELDDNEEEEEKDEDEEKASKRSDFCLTYYDFAFHFVPGFCGTTHMAQS